MEIKVLQEETRDKIKLLITDDMADVIVMPEVDEENERPKQKKGKVVVGYQQSEFSDTLVTNGVAQIEKALVIITFQSRTLYGDNGIYTLLGKVKTQLIGWTPSNCDVPYKAKYFGPPESYTKPRQDEIWTFEYHIETRAPYVQEADQDDVIANTGGDVPLGVGTQLVFPTEGDLYDQLQLQGPIALISIQEIIPDLPA